MMHPANIEASLSQHMIAVENGRIEGLLLTPPTFRPKRGFVVLIHGFNHFGGWEMMWFARPLIREGYAVLLPSQLGFGESQGERDYCGSRTISGIHPLIQEVRKENAHFGTSKIALWGISRGATVAALLLGKYPSEYSAGILQAGVYDLRADYDWERKDSQIKKHIEVETGATDAAFAKRDAIHLAEHIHAPVLVMHGERDDVVFVEQARKFSVALATQHELVILEHRGHKISDEATVTKYVLPFLERYMG